MTESVSNILIICPSMWPKMSGWGETQRMYYLANDLAEHGNCVYTVSPDYECGIDNKEKEQKYKSYFWGKRIISDSFHKAESNSRKASEVYQELHNLAGKILSPGLKMYYGEPNFFEAAQKHLWLMEYQNDICRLIREKNIDIVIISVPEFVLLRLAKKIRKRFPNIELIYDYRDPWYLWFRKKNLAYYREKRWLAYADHIVGFSDNFCRDMVRDMSLSEEKVSLIYNGFSEKDWSAFERKYSPGNKEKNKLRITYTGNVSLLNRKDNYRNLSMLIQKIKEYADIELYLVGVKGEKAGTVENNIHYIGSVSQEKSFFYMVESDILLSIHDTKDCSGIYLISGKFFDYIRSRKVIWHIGDSRSLMAKMIQKYQLGITCENRCEELKVILDSLIVQWRRGAIEELRNGSDKNIEFFSREYQNGKYRDILQHK